MVLHDIYVMLGNLRTTTVGSALICEKHHYIIETKRQLNSHQRTSASEIKSTQVLPLMSLGYQRHFTVAYNSEGYMECFSTPRLH